MEILAIIGKREQKKIRNTVAIKNNRYHKCVSSQERSACEARFIPLDQSPT